MDNNAFQSPTLQAVRTAKSVRFFNIIQVQY